MWHDLAARLKKPKQKQGQVSLSHLGWKFMHIENTTCIFIPMGKSILNHVQIKWCEVLRNTSLS